MLGVLSSSCYNRYVESPESETPIQKFYESFVFVARLILKEKLSCVE